MNLLTEKWIPVRPLHGGAPERVSLAEVHCTDTPWLLCLPRDDMELAALQLLICLTQISWIPEDDTALRRYLSQPMSQGDFDKGIGQWGEMFRLDHPTAPALQVKGVSAKEATGMDKLLAGLTGATNCAFVNEPGQGAMLCGGCAAIALFNQANNAPSFGGGFKSGLRGGSPVTTLVQAVDASRADLRTTLWLNVLTKPRLQTLLGDDLQLAQPPTWQAPIKEGAKVAAGSIGLVRGLFWQPAHVQLCPPVEEGQCSGCGHSVAQRYHGFLKAKFGFTVEGTWPHPHSPKLLQNKKGQVEEKFLAFTTAAPSWTQLSRVLTRLAEDKGGAQMPAAVIAQCRELFAKANTHLILGGYRNNQASILERRHEVMALNHGWQTHGEVVERLVQIGLGYKTALRKSLFTFAEGVKSTDIKGAGVAVQEGAERDYFAQSESLLTELLITLNFDQPQPQLEQLQQQLQELCLRLFEKATAPYCHHPKLVRVLAVARRSLHKHLSELTQPQGGQDAA